jgi:hypothetical protein
MFNDGHAAMRVRSSYPNDVRLSKDTAFRIMVASTKDTQRFCWKHRRSIDFLHPYSAVFSSIRVALRKVAACSLNVQTRKYLVSFLESRITLEPLRTKREAKKFRCAGLDRAAYALVVVVRPLLLQDLWRYSFLFRTNNDADSSND